jgi:AcrR family transcriptional regulator
VRKDAKDRWERIVVAAAPTFARDGYAVVLDTIAVESGVGRATLYRNFADRCEVALAVIQRHIAPSVGAVADSVGERPTGFLLMLHVMCEARTDHGALAAAVAAQHGDHGRLAIPLVRGRRAL